MSAERQEYMHKEGEFMVVNARVHKLLNVGSGYDPADVECEEYLAVCGVESQSWSMPSQKITSAQFFPSLSDAVIKGFMICRDCFPGGSDHDS